MVAATCRAATPHRYANRREKAKSMNAKSSVSRQLSPFIPGKFVANARRSRDGRAFPTASLKPAKEHCPLAAQKRIRLEHDHGSRTRARLRLRSHHPAF